MRRASLAVLLAGLLLPSAALAQTATPANGEIAPAAAYGAVQSGRTLLIDTRETDEKHSGAPAGVGAEITYDMGGRHDREFVSRVLQATNGQRDADVTLICQGGVRSAAAEKALERDGFSHVHTVAGGYDDWRAQKLPSKPTQ